MDYIFKNAHAQSVQISKDSEVNGLLVPFVSFDDLLALHYANVYHRRAIKIKANMLSQIEVYECDLARKMPPNISAKSFLFEFAYNLELFGNAPIEKAGGGENFVLYNIPAHEWRTNRMREIFQVTRDGDQKKLDGYYLKYYSPTSRYYGEPDYLPCLLQILINREADSYNYSFFKNGAKPDLAIVHENNEPTTEQIVAYKSFFSDSFKGANNAHKTLLAYTNSIGDKEAKIRFEKLGGVEDISFKALKEVSRDEIAAAHGIPPLLLGIIQGAHLGGGGELIGQLQQFNEIEIKPKIELIEGFFASIGIKVVLKAIDVTDFKDDGEIVTMLVERGIISVAEARSILGWQKNI
ncbi:phage portal protein [Campylobacter sp. FMV-PI01]|uniref:Phage portal protein n=1 Tax=Campylobacter portucalensis TaxID=2608384 RepID=A0A6L5WI85_9BACT|nr:phage portal protein [Campylobacter portucalensis]MSN96764.1 phage portal protein [Campylobacter portucalensis]